MLRHYKGNRTKKKQTEAGEKMVVEQRAIQTKKLNYITKKGKDTCVFKETRRERVKTHPVWDYGRY